MGKPKKKEPEHKNKKKKGDLLFEKIEANTTLSDPLKKRLNSSLNVNQFFDPNHSKTACVWITHKDYIEEIIININLLIQSSGLGFTKVFQMALAAKWDFNRVNDSIEQNYTGLTLKRIVSTFRTSQKDICLMCKELKEEFYSLDCNHKFCTDCYKIHISLILNEGIPEKMVKATCPKKGCQVKVHHFINIKEI